MKKIIAVLILSGLLSAPLSPAVPDRLDPWYRGYNSKYFGNELPEYVLITHTLSDDRFMAVTVYSGGHYHIDFNPKYGYHPNPKAESITELRNLLHESCHIQVFVEDQEEFDDHGPNWQACMYRLAKQKAFESLW